MIHVIAGIIIGVGSAVIATAFGYTITDLEWWGFYLMLEIPYLMGFFVGRRK